MQYKTFHSVVCTFGIINKFRERVFRGLTFVPLFSCPKY